MGFGESFSEENLTKVRLRRAGVPPRSRLSSRTPTSFSTLPCLKKTSVGTGRRQVETNCKTIVGRLVSNCMQQWHHLNQRKNFATSIQPASTITFSSDLVWQERTALPTVRIYGGALWDRGGHYQPSCPVVEQLLNCVFFLVRMKSGSKAQADLGGKGSPASFCAWDGWRGDTGPRNTHFERHNAVSS